MTLDELLDYVREGYMMHTANGEVVYEFEHSRIQAALEIREYILSEIRKWTNVELESKEVELLRIRTGVGLED